MKKPQENQALSAFLRRVPVKLIVALSVNIIVFLGVFLVAWDCGLEWPITLLYSVITLAAALYYIIYNRGVIGKLPTHEMLPPTWDKTTREAFLDDMKERRKKSKWVMTILIPMILVFAYKILDIVFLSRISPLF